MNVRVPFSTAGASVRPVRLAVVLPILMALVLVLTLVVLKSTGLLHLGATTRKEPPTAPAAAGASGPRAVRCDVTPTAAPSTPPPGAVPVSTSEALPAIVSAHPAGTTYWLAPGTHRLGSGRYNQVVPKDGDTFLGAPGAVLDGHHVNSYAFGGQATDVTIGFLTVQNFGSPGLNNNEGVVNHDSALRWTVKSSTIQHNAGAGVMVGSGDRLIDNCLRKNGQYGFSAYRPDGVTDIVLEGNEIAGNNTDDWEKRQPGCGCTGGGKFWATTGARVVGNYVHDNLGVGLWADNNNVSFLFENNIIAGNDSEGLMYETSYNASILHNTFTRNALVKGPKNPGFPTAAIYLSESGGDSRVGGQNTTQLQVRGNQFTDNWSGVVAWENADRFAGSPANTSTGQAPLGNPTVATVKACAQPANIVKAPYLDDCRWKTQNVVVEENVFSLDPTKVPLCARITRCGFNGLFSNYGTYPSWSPYKGDVVAKNISLQQHNLWRDNTYEGDWHFIAGEIGHAVSWDEWRASPYNQDADSTMS